MSLTSFVINLSSVFKDAVFSLDISPEHNKETLALTDNEPPEIFQPQIVEDNLIYGGRPVLVFQTQDKGSGIDHYEVRIGAGGFIRAESPYPLDKKAIGSVVYVRAIDRAGNERTVNVRPETREAEQSVSPILLGVFAGVVIVSVVSLYRWRKRSRHYYTRY